MKAKTGDPCSGTRLSSTTFRMGRCLLTEYLARRALVGHTTLTTALVLMVQLTLTLEVALLSLVVVDEQLPSLSAYSL